MTKQKQIKVSACMTLPRYGANSARNVIEQAFNAAGIQVQCSTGVFWEQKMQTMFDAMLAGGVDIGITVDSDTFCTTQDIERLLTTMINDETIDAVAALEPHQLYDKPLCSLVEAGEVNASKPFMVATAHFGLTAIRIPRLEHLPKPWFHGQPNSEGDWLDGKVDPDIYFWNQWKAAGNSIYVDPAVKIGHLYEAVRYYDEDNTVKSCSTIQYRQGA